VCKKRKKGYEEKYEEHLTKSEGAYLYYGWEGSSQI